MATRRARIKGVLKIPPRRVVVEDTTESQVQAIPKTSETTTTQDVQKSDADNATKTLLVNTQDNADNLIKDKPEQNLSEDLITHNNTENSSVNPEKSKSSVNIDKITSIKNETTKDERKEVGNVIVKPEDIKQNNHKNTKTVIVNNQNYIQPMSPIKCPAKIEESTLHLSFNADAIKRENSVIKSFETKDNYENTNGLQKAVVKRATNSENLMKINNCIGRKDINDAKIVIESTDINKPTVIKHPKHINELAVLKKPNPINEPNSETEPIHVSKPKRIKIQSDILISSQSLLSESPVCQIPSFPIGSLNDHSENNKPGILLKSSKTALKSAISCPQNLTLQINDDHKKSASDVEMPPALASPTKIVNWRKRAIPKFGHQRRISFSFHGSASESEDDSKRTSFSRVRNDSVCSVASVASTHISQLSAAESDLKKGINRKIRRGVSRRMVEARREFNAKCEGGKPDRQKLTMLDLIFYNPSTNQMTEKKKKPKLDSISSSNEAALEEQEDDPLKIEPEPDPKNEPEDDDMPVPQIKVDPNGEIIIDEKSLVIENQSTKINRQLMQNSEIIDGDLDVGMGYKKAKRHKEWTKSETIRFYNALNSIGTDFMLMCELFPHRSRKELKLKFKKEEKLNRQLVDKALTQPRQFDMDDLFKELEEEKQQIERMEKLKQEKMKKLETLRKTKYSSKNGIHRPVDENKKPKRRKPKVKISKRTTYDYVKEGILSVLRESDDETMQSEFVGSSNSNTNDNIENKDEYDSHQPASNEDSDDEVVSFSSKPTRSGRMPKPRQKSPILVEEAKPRKQRISNPAKKLGRPKKILKTEQNLDSEEDKKIEPGSIMIISSTNPTGEQIYQVYMVTQGEEKTQIELGPDILQNLTQAVTHQPVPNLPFVAENILTISSQPEETPIAENNVTIIEGDGGSMRPMKENTATET